MRKRPAAPEPVPEAVTDALGNVVCTHGEPRGALACALCRAAARIRLEGSNPYVRPDTRGPSAPMPAYVREMLNRLSAGKSADLAVQDALDAWDGK